MAEFEASGLSRKRFAKSKRLNVATLGNWLRRAGRERRPDTASALVPVRIESGLRKSGLPAHFEVLLGERFGIRVPADFDEEALRRLLRVLESAC